MDIPSIRRELHLWVSDDRRHIPVAAIGEVKGRAVRATLLSRSGGRAPR